MGVFVCAIFVFFELYLTIMKKTEPDKKNLRTWIDIDDNAACHNYDVFRRLVGNKVKIMAVVKSNAYGHSLVDFSSIMDKCGADWFAVDSILEGSTLRRNSIKRPILVLGHTLESRLKEAAEENISITISNLEFLKILLKKSFDGKKPLKVHLKVDSGMHRQGFLASQIDELLFLLKKLPKNIKIEGIYTHFAAAKNPSFPRDTRNQIDLFKNAVEKVKALGFNPMVHAAATSGTLVFPESHFDMVRIGIGLYGMWPSVEVKRFFEDKIELKPVLSWKTIISEVKKLPEGGGVGYDFTEKVSPNSKIAICPIGYWHGFHRIFSGVGHVLVGGQRVKVLGRVTMDMIILDVSKIKNVKVNDEVVIIGKQGKEKVTADELAELAGTINYEITTTLNPLIKRFVI